MAIKGQMDLNVLKKQMEKTAQQKRIAKKDAQRRKQQRERQQLKAAESGCDAWRQNLQDQQADQREQKTALAVSRRQSDGRFVSRDDQLAAIKAVYGTTKVVFVNG